MYPFTGQTSKGGIYYALLIWVQNEMCRIISTRNMGRNAGKSYEEEFSKKILGMW